MRLVHATSVAFLRAKTNRLKSRVPEMQASYFVDTPAGSSPNLRTVRLPVPIQRSHRQTLRGVFRAVEPSTRGEKTNLHLTFLLNFFDELKRRAP
jgi:hypothetical protein